MTKSKKPKIGLALGSGGAKGLAHIGVIKVLATNNIPINFIAGSSMGALVGAYYAAYKDLDKLEKVALSSSWRTGLSLLDPTWKGGIIKGKKIEALIKTWLDEISFDNLKIPLTVVTTDLITGKEVRINSGEITRAVRASLSVPAIFQPIKYKGQLLADGGLSNPLPDNVARQMGADFVIAVNLDNEYFDNGLSENSLSLPKVSTRSLNVMRYHLAQNCLKTADIIIEPRVGEIGLVGWKKFFNSQKAKQIIKVGEDATFQVLAKIENYLN